MGLRYIHCAWIKAIQREKKLSKNLVCSESTFPQIKQKIDGTL